MKKIFLTFFAIIASANIALAQVTVSTSKLTGTKWQLIVDGNLQSKPYYEFTNNNAIWHCSDGTTFSFPFYLSSAIPTTFDFTKVGKETKGCYFIKYNSKLGIFYCYAIMSFNKNTGKMVCKCMNKDIIGLTDTFTYVLMK